MSCCNSQPLKKKVLTGTQICPACHHKGTPVSPTTMIKHIEQPWLFAQKLFSSGAENPTQQANIFYFCHHPQCDLVYFSVDQSLMFKQNQLRTLVGFKNSERKGLLCFCFGVSAEMLEQQPEIKDFIIRQTRAKLCACEAMNPSGQCCLRDFPK